MLFRSIRSILATMSRPYRIITTQYSRFRSATCRLFGCTTKRRTVQIALFMNGYPITMNGENLTMGEP